MFARTATVLAAALLAWAATPAWPATEAQADAACVKCHDKLAKGKSVHRAPKAGCSACHDVTDGSATPHTSARKAAKALVAEGDAICAKCHDPKAYDKKVKHRALRSGCIYCHNPHASEHEHLLTLEVNAGCIDCHEDDEFQANAKGRHRALRSGCTYCHDAHASTQNKLMKTSVAETCRDCHDGDEFAAKAKHAPVKEGKCLSCHSPHASPHSGLLAKPYREGCLECHADVSKLPHAVAGFSRKGHPVGGEKQGLEDPARKGQPFDCASCHETHASSVDGMLRLNGGKAADFCQRCHKL